MCLSGPYFPKLPYHFEGCEQLNKSLGYKPCRYYTIKAVNEQTARTQVDLRLDINTS